MAMHDLARVLRVVHRVLIYDDALSLLTRALVDHVWSLARVTTKLLLQACVAIGLPSRLSRGNDRLKASEGSCWLLASITLGHCEVLEGAFLVMREFVLVRVVYV